MEVVKRFISKTSHQPKFNKSLLWKTYFPKYVRNLASVNLVGRDILTPDQLSSADLKSLIWTAFDLKTSQLPINALNFRHVTLVFVKRSARYQIAFERAARDLGATSTTYIDPQWAEQPDIADSGRLLSKVSDCVVVSGVTHTLMDRLASGATIPVLNCSSDLFSLVKALSDIMTLQENLAPLRRRCLAWIGPPTTLCNTYIYLAPKLELNLRVFCICSRGNGLMSSVSLEHGHKLCRSRSELHECSSAADAAYRADVIATTMHDVPQNCITFKVLKEASLDWYLLHALPRSHSEVSDEVFEHKNNLTWKSVENTRFVAMALLLRVLRSYEPTSPMPDFNGPL